MSGQGEVETIEKGKKGNLFSWLGEGVIKNRKNTFKFTTLFKNTLFEEEKSPQVVPKFLFKFVQFCSPFQ